MNYRIEPKVVASTKGQGGDSGAAGISVPVIVSGPWDDISYAPDLAGMIGGAVGGVVGGVVEGVVETPVKAIETITNIVPGLNSGSNKSSSEKGSSSKESSSPLPDPTKMLKGLFGR